MVKLNNRQELTEKRKELRNNATFLEAKLWKYLKGKQIAGYKFRRQHSVGPYILDFYCPQRRLGIEIDGIQHEQVDRKKYDEERTKYLDVEFVVAEIEKRITTPLPPPCE